eukprot:scaffold44276_cov43-Attheya_sp.AAC.1
MDGGSTERPQHLLKLHSRRLCKFPISKGSAPSALHSRKFNSVRFIKDPISLGKVVRNLHLVMSSSWSW